MQTQETSTTAPPLQRSLDMSVAMSEIDREVEARLRKIARTAKMAGFRPGKVPFKLITQQYGPQARSEATGVAVQKAFSEAVRSRSLRVAGYPRFDRKDGGDPGNLEISAVFEVYPDIVPADVGGCEITRPVIEVGEAEVDKTIEVLRKQRTHYHEVQRSGAGADRMTIDFSGRIGGEPFKGGEATDFVMTLGAGAMLPGFESALAGMAAGEKKSFELTFPDDYHVKDVAGRSAVFEVTVKRVEEPHLPEVDAEFARSLGIADGDLERMRSEVRSNLEREVRKRVRGRVKEQVMNALLAANPVELPSALVQEEAHQLAHNAQNDLRQRGLDPKTMGVDPGWFTETAQRRVKLGLILAEIVKSRGLAARPEQVRAMVDDFAQSYEDPSEVVRWYYANHQSLAQVEALVIEDNVVDWVLENARVTDTPVSFDELMGNTA
ncbi:MAG TPA: trigger factor [Rhodocyclaceae bacterium]|nr:MAG: trigger factor [Betaproteobacteria bacterium CG2_30_68_42]PIV71524.1 MAG: trigger factor [Rhodocyclales bacterium CG17_big_fil_post_rev_8_21_14_2_50_68_7]PIX74704.1 MAG: trigger factor [Rhodocyclales bacterium CG_4_10_14_3_um_filter_68_10]PJA58022.1 MAG: trigger factor [Rhodocyclales bacterium CG_4_9_14_3_um_filter_68_10]HCX33515.1 trigger factor [Rhodocyclaceae bacterium]